VIPFLSLVSPLCVSGRDMNSEPCQRFFREGLTTSFIRILTDDAVSTWKPDIQVICGGGGGLNRVASQASTHSWVKARLPHFKGSVYMYV
jgi:hypothetical protein